MNRFDIGRCHGLLKCRITCLRAIRGRLRLLFLILYGSNHLKLDECYVFLGEVSRSHQQNLADVNSNRNVYTCFPGTLSLTDVKAHGMFSFMG